MIKTLKQNIYNKTWWVAVISAIIMLGKIWGIDITDYIGKDWQNTLNILCSLAILFGISNDTTTQNIGGAINEIVQETSQIENNTTVNQTPNQQILTQNKLNQIQQILNQ